MRGVNVALTVKLPNPSVSTTSTSALMTGITTTVKSAVRCNARKVGSSAVTNDREYRIGRTIVREPKVLTWKEASLLLPFMIVMTVVVGFVMGVWVVMKLVSIILNLSHEAGRILGTMFSSRTTSATSEKGARDNDRSYHSHRFDEE